MTGLFVNRSIHHVLNRTKPSLHPPLSRRNPIKCCEPYAPRFFSSTSFFMFFSFFPNPLIPLAQTRIFLRSFAYPPCGSEWSNDDKHEQRNRKAGTAGWSGGLATHPALSAPLPPAHLRFGAPVASEGRQKNATACLRGTRLLSRAGERNCAGQEPRATRANSSDT